MFLQDAVHTGVCHRSVVAVSIPQRAPHAVMKSKIGCLLPAFSFFLCKFAVLLETKDYHAGNKTKPYSETFTERA